MAHMADELAFSQAQASTDGGGGGLVSTVDVPDIVNDDRLLRLVPWGGDGADPLAVQEGPGA